LVVIGWPVLGIGSQSRPVALFLDLLVGNGTFYDEDKGFKFSLLGLVPILEKIVAVLVSEDRIVQMDCGQTGNCA